MAGRRHESLIPLSHDHREALGLAFRLHNPVPPGRATPMTPPTTPRGRAEETLDFFEQHLRPHFRAEEEHVFPFLEEALGEAHPACDLMARIRAEHVELRLLTERLRADLRAGRDLEPTLTAFADLLETHVRSEERELFASFPDLPAERTAPLAQAIRKTLGRSRGVSGT